MNAPNVVMLSHYKGGTGKSTVAMNLARALQLMKKDVILVDLDDSSRTSMSWLKSWSALHPEGEPAPLPPIVSMVGDVKSQITKLAQVHDIVVVDAGAGAPRQNVSAIQVADLLIIPVGPSHFDLHPTLTYIYEIAAAQAKCGGRPRARTLLNRIASNRSSAEEAVATLMGEGIPIRPMETIIPMREALTKLLSSGVTVFDYPRASDLRPMFMNLAKEVLKELAACPTIARNAAA